MTEATDRPLAQRLKEALGDSYTIEGEIGRGGMGVVYRARDERLHRRVAIKVLPPELAFQREIRERFTREAQTAARLSHPHIVPIHDVGEGLGLVYFVMGLVEGESLAARLKRRKKLPPEEARRIMKETADALSAAHGVSIIHRDIKPDNILLEGTRGRVMVTDFGIAKAMSASSGATLTGAGVAIGTPSFMSPEQAAGEKEIDGRSDIYSLGIVTYQMLTGELPFAAPTVAGILMKQITEPAPVLHELTREIPEDLSLAVSRCLEKDPESRWPTADALRRSLESRTVTGYRPSATGTRPAARRASTGTSGLRPRPSRTQPGDRESARAGGDRGSSGGGLARRDLADRPLARGSRRPELAGGRYRRNERGEWVRTERDADEQLIRDTGEPAIVQKVRARFARWAAVSGGLFMLNIATGLDSPWFLFPAGFMAIPLLRGYASLWQSGYSWRDVLNRPPAKDAIMAPGSKSAKVLGAPDSREFGKHFEPVRHAWDDRKGVLKLMGELPKELREQLPEIGKTIDALYSRALEMARALHETDSAGLNALMLPRIESQIQALQDQADTPERKRQLQLLEDQQKYYQQLHEQRNRIAVRLDSSVLALQNIRLKLLGLRTQGVQSTIGELTQVTQAAQALSRDVDFQLQAAREIKEAIG